MAFEFILNLLEIILVSVLIILPFGYDLSAKFRYYLKFCVLYIILILTSIIFLPFTIWRCNRGGKLLFSSALSNFIGAVLNLRCRISGIENLQKEKPFVMVTNRQGLIDIIAMLKIWSQLHDCVIVDNDTIYSNPLTLLWSSNHNLLKKMLCCAQSTLFKDIRDILNKKNLWIFPKTLHDTKTDIFQLLIKEKLPIVPVVVSKFYFLETINKQFEPGYIMVKILPQIPMSEQSVDDIPKIIQHTELILEDGFTRLSKEVTPPTIDELRQSYNTLC